MTEQEKMASGLLYDATDPALEAQRSRCKELCHQANQIPPLQQQARNALLRTILGRTGTHFTIEPSFWCDYGYHITLGEHFYANHNLVILDCAPVTFGDHVFIAPNCGFHTAGHPVDAARRNAGWEYARPITVGDDVWFGAGVQVLPGVTIGCDCVIGAGSVVTRDIPPHSVAAGNPCRVLRPITKADRETCFGPETTLE